MGSLAATGLTAGVPALLSHIMRRKTANDPKYQEIIRGLAPAPVGRVEATQPPVTNIIGSGVRKKRGSGIKKF